jgi:hypothetical protein
MEQNQYIMFHGKSVPILPAGARVAVAPPAYANGWRKIIWRTSSAMLSINWICRPSTRFAKEKRGQPPYDPRLMTKLLVYGYCTGVFSSRKIPGAHSPFSF